MSCAPSSAHGITSNEDNRSRSHAARMTMPRPAGTGPTSGHDSTSRPHHHPRMRSVWTLRSTIGTDTGGREPGTTGASPAFSPDDTDRGTIKSSSMGPSFSSLTRARPSSSRRRSSITLTDSSQTFDLYVSCFFHARRQTSPLT